MKLLKLVEGMADWFLDVFRWISLFFYISDTKDTHPEVYLSDSLSVSFRCNSPRLELQVKVCISVWAL